MAAMHLKDFLANLPKDRDFAAEIGVSRQALYRYCEGDRTPRPSIMIRIREATGGQVTADDFMPARPLSDVAHEAAA